MVVFSPVKPGAESWAEALPHWTGRSDCSILHGEISPRSCVLSSLAPSDPVKGMTVLFQTNVVVTVEVVCWSNSLYFWLEIAGKQKPFHTAPMKEQSPEPGSRHSAFILSHEEHIVVCPTFTSFCVCTADVNAHENRKSEAYIFTLVLCFKACVHLSLCIKICMQLCMTGPFNNTRFVCIMHSWLQFICCALQSPFGTGTAMLLLLVRWTECNWNYAKLTGFLHAPSVTLDRIRQVFFPSLKWGTCRRCSTVASICKSSWQSFWRYERWGSFANRWLHRLCLQMYFLLRSRVLSHLYLEWLNVWRMSASDRWCDLST